MKKLSLLLISLLLISCGQQDTQSEANEDLSSSVEDAVNTISALMDDQGGSSYATSMNKSTLEILNEAIMPKAYASSCIRPVFKNCVSQSKSSTFEDCSMFRGNVLASGQIDLDYNTSDCSLDDDGDQVNRTYDYELVGPRGGQLQVSSASHTDYRGNVLGGGAQAVKTSSGYELTVFGKHKVFVRNGNTRMDKSIRTLTPLEVTGGLSRALRRVNNGQIEVIHNLAEFTATYTASNLEWSSACCHPVSGSLNVSYSGSREGFATVEFNSCGSAQLDKDGEIQDVSFTYCE